MKLSSLEKKFIVLTLALAMILSFAPISKKSEAASGSSAVTQKSIIYVIPQKSGNSNDKTYGEFRYREDGNGNVVITGYKGSSKKVTVPSKIDGKKVIAVYGAFKDNTKVTDISLPDTVVRIEYEAFCGATNLVNVNLDSVKKIGFRCFIDCESLGDIVLPECLVDTGEGFNGAHIKNLTVSNYLAGLPKSLGRDVKVDNLKFKEGITKIWMNFQGISTSVIMIPDSVVDMKYAKFSYANTKVIIGKGVKELYKGQFAGVDDFEIVLGQNIKSIGQYAFCGAKISSLKIPDSVTEIQYNAFLGTANLKNVTFSKNLVKSVGGYDGFMNGSLWYKNQQDGVVYTGSSLYTYKGSVPKNTQINVKSGTKGIAYRAFQTAATENITKVTLPDGLLYIGGVSFFNTGISEINIPETVTEIGPGAFGNTNLKSVYIPKSVTKIGVYSFGYKCDDFKNNSDVWINEDCYLDKDKKAEVHTESGYVLTCDFKYTDKYMNDENKIVSKEAGFDIYLPTCLMFLRSLDTDSFYCNQPIRKAGVPSKVSGFAIKGYKGTAAEKYAKANGFSFIELKDGIYQENGSLVYYRNNSLATGVTDVIKDPRTANWYNVVKGKVVSGPTVAKNASGWWYINKDGVVDFNYGGLCKYNGNWWYLKNGKIDFSYTGLAKYNGSWWYVKGGKVDFSYIGLCKYNGSWWYVNKGQVKFSYTGLCKYNGSWWYVNKGQVNFKYTGFAKYNGSWWYVNKGQVKFIDTVEKNSNGWWAVFNGRIDFKFAGIAKNSSGSWYCKDGMVQFGFSGTVQYNGKSYKVQYGKVVN